MARIGDTLASWARGDRLNHAEIEQMRRSMNEMHAQSRQLSNWGDNLGGISTVVSPVPVDVLFSHTVSANSTGVSVKFTGSKYATALIAGSVIWDEAATGGLDGDSLALRVNGDTSTGAYPSVAHYGYGTSGAQASTTAIVSTLGHIALTGWAGSSISSTVHPHSFFAILSNVNSTGTKSGIVFYNRWIDPASRKACVTHAFWYTSTGPINTFDFQLLPTTNVAGAALGYMLPGSKFSAYGFK